MLCVSWFNFRSSFAIYVWLWWLIYGVLWFYHDYHYILTYSSTERLSQIKIIRNIEGRDRTHSCVPSTTFTSSSRSWKEMPKQASNQSLDLIRFSHRSEHAKAEYLQQTRKSSEKYGNSISTLPDNFQSSFPLALPPSPSPHIHKWWCMAKTWQISAEESNE